MHIMHSSSLPTTHYPLRSNAGFTLIELLVVIAIIGILSSVVLASLSSARSKGADAAVKSALGSMRSQIEIDLDGSYNATSISGRCPAKNTSSFCGTTPGVLCQTKEISIFSDITSKLGVTLYGGTDIPNSYCWADPSNYTIQVPLKSSGFFCIDSTGNTTVSATALPAGTGKVCL